MLEEYNAAEQTAKGWLVGLSLDWHEANPYLSQIGWKTRRELWHDHVRDQFTSLRDNGETFVSDNGVTANLVIGFEPDVSELEKRLDTEGVSHVMTVRLTPQDYPVPELMVSAYHGGGDFDLEHRNHGFTFGKWADEPRVVATTQRQPPVGIELD